MHNILLYYAFFIIVIGIFFLSISFRVLIQKKPVILNSVILFGFVAFCFLPSIVLSIFGIHSAHHFTIMHVLTFVIFLLFLVYFGFIIRGYSFYGIRGDDFRERLLNALDANGVKHEEKLNKISLPEIGNELNVSCQEWMGTGMIRLRHRKDAAVFKKIIRTFKDSFTTTQSTVSAIISVFYGMFGLLCTGMCVYILVLFFNLHR